MAKAAEYYYIIVDDDLIIFFSTTAATLDRLSFSSKHRLVSLLWLKRAKGQLRR